MKKFLPHLIAFVVFIAISLVYFSPVLKDKQLNQHDIKEFSGMAKEITDHREKTGEEALWTNRAFSGMPAFQISVRYPSNLMAWVQKVMTFGMPFPASVLFMLMFGFYILVMVIKPDPWLGVLGGIAFAFSSFFFVSITAGHNTKVVAISYMAPVLAGIILTYRGQLLAGGALTALFLGLEILANHLQITYYLFMLVLIYIIFEFVHVVRTKNFMPFAKATSVLGLAAILAVGSNFGNIWSTYEYGKSTTRGKSELTSDMDDKTSGLDKSYATGWSYGKAETMTLMIPDFKGGASGAIGEKHKDAVKKVDNRMRQTVASMDSYWGDQPITAGPSYAGAVVVFLFVLGLFVVEGRMKWFLLAGTLMSVTLAWGKNWMWLTDLFLEHFPGYNKFRSVSMMLTVAELCLPFLAVIALDKLIGEPNTIKEPVKVPFMSKPVSRMRMFYLAFILTGGISLLFFLSPGTSSLTKADEYEQLYSQIKSGNPNAPDDQVREYLDDLLGAAETARAGILRSDAGRSFILITIAALILWFYFRNRFDKRYLYATLTFIILVDMWSVDKRYLSNDQFVDKKEAKEPFKPSKADLQILEDKDPDFRVLNLAVSPFNDASTSYFHKSIGGYHGAKLKRYQELIENQIYRNIQAVSATLNSTPSDSALRATFATQAVMNMLNTKYIIYNPDAPPLENRYALGHAWFVKEVKWVPNADTEIAEVGGINPAVTALVDERFKQDLAGFTPTADATATISLKEYKPNYLVYETQSASDQLAVFSEIYYNPGWNATIDGTPASHFRANYVLRAMRIPAGKHKVEFRFEPKTYVAGEKISMFSSLALLLLVAGGGVMALRKRAGPSAE